MGGIAGTAIALVIVMAVVFVIIRWWWNRRKHSKLWAAGTAGGYAGDYDDGYGVASGGSGACEPDDSGQCQSSCGGGGGCGGGGCGGGGN